MRRVALVGIILVVGITAQATSKDPPPVMLDLGPVKPTPAPTPEPATRRRLITTLTIQNVAGGESVVSFEATDVADQGQGKFRVVAAARYSLSDDAAKLQETRTKIISKIRDLEHDLLDYAKLAGPPKDRKPILSDSSSSASDDKTDDKTDDKK